MDAPNAVDRLRRFVLDLAVRGKLVEQDPADEPASELLRRIAVEKARMVESGEIRRPRNLSNGEDLVPPFEIPTTWCWRRLDVVGAIVGGGTPRAGDPRNFSEPGEGVAWLTPKDLGGHRSSSIERGSRDLSEKGLRCSSATLMPTGTVLFSSRAPIGYVAIASNPISTNQGFKSIVPYVSDCSKYIGLAMQAFAPEIEARAPGTTFKEASGKIVAGVPFPLPPLAEQRRIVAKVDELMALCDRLEETRAAREDTRGRLTKASYARLSDTDTDAPTYRTHARFAVKALAVLTARADQVKQLRQTILSLAVRGRLVNQDPADEPALELLKRIAVQRAKTPRAKRRRSPTLETGGTDQGFSDLPIGWQWTPLAGIADVTMGQSPPGATYNKSGEGVPLINGPVEFTPGPFGRTIVNQFTTAPKKLCKEGDLLICVRGSTTGRTNVAAFRACIGRGVAAISSSFDDEFIRLFLWKAREEIISMGRGMAFPSVSKKQLENLAIPLPPLAEQRRIVAKVDDLMALCDRVETGLAVVDDTRSRLLESTLHDVLGPAQPEHATAAHSGHVGTRPGSGRSGDAAAWAPGPRSVHLRSITILTQV